MLLREATDLSRYSVELRSLPGVLAEPADDPVLLVERFAGDPAAARARFTVVDQGTANVPSDWRFTDCMIPYPCKSDSASARRM